MKRQMVQRRNEIYFISILSHLFLEISSVVRYTDRRIESRGYALPYILAQKSHDNYYVDFLIQENNIRNKEMES